MVSFQVLIATLMFTGTTLAWQNNYDGPLNFECKDNEYMASVRSHHDNHHEDRQWQYGCQLLSGSNQIRNCKWYEDVNEMDQLLSFRCPANQVIAGVKSRHDNHHEDRVFGFRCCELVERKLNYCSLTSFINQYDGDMNYVVPHDYAIVGFNSEENDHHE